MKLRLKTKIIGSMCIVVLITLVLSGTFTYRYFADILKKQALKDDNTKLNQTMAQLSYMSDDIKKFAYNILVDEDIQKFLRTTYYSEKFEENKSINNAMQKLSYYVPLRDYIHSMVVVDPKGAAYWNAYPYDQYYTQKLKENWYTNFNKDYKGSGFTEEYQIQINGVKTNLISYIVPLKSVDEPDKIMGKLIINLKLQELIRALNLDNNDNDGFVWLGQQNEVLFSKYSNIDKIDTSSLLKDITDKKGNKTLINERIKEYVLVNYSGQTGWKLISFTSKEKIYKSINYVFYFTLLFVFLSIVFVIALVIPLIFNFTKPITILGKAMKSVSNGNLQTNVNISSGDELELLGKGFNLMVKDLKKYIDQSIDNEKIKRQMEFELLLSKINPHFIYNTLNTVIYYARKQGNQDIVQLMTSFIAILQDGIKISDQGVMATLKQEINVTNHYILIQKYKYLDRFELELDVDSGLENQLIPKTLIQPLVENALIHGILMKEHKGTIRVTVKQQEQDIRIEVEDDGIGMDEEIIEKLLNGGLMKTDDRVRSIGVPNIIDRIKYLYGSNFGLEITSQYGVGTKMVATIPIDKSKL